ncbi:hypothetical protein JR316_0007293 [Psilocybe cubensis]|uniref:Uncharacterized protein n=2 Tax=Psilocybe cubensis TaxID=181762 RepID=A0ACB8GY74_PSICU|nr:hypothetical protein JR316_0007293 [Psilocybe cubensis]KAH9480693.1 hypothetical protein JR316_0007293 [Psilocybe cubensis]
MQFLATFSLFSMAFVSAVVASDEAAFVGSCSNAALMGDKNQNYAKEGCVSSKSKGWMSSHNCVNKGGKAYLCVQGDTTTCISGSTLKQVGLENGECFN